MNLIQRFLPLLLIMGISTLGKSCTPKDEDGTPNESITEIKFTTKTEKLTVKVDTLYSAFQNPWGMTWIGDGKMLVTERKGEILIFKDDKYTGQKIQGLPAVYANGQAGLLDITVHPDFAQNGWIYIAYAKPVPGGGATTVARFKLNGNTVASFEELIVTTPAWNGGTHYGSRIVFDNQKFLYFTNGERGSQNNAQNLTNSHGKVHRIHDDGRIPADNPFVNTANAVPSIWTYGNRNPQGMIYDQTNNRIWSVEHGPMGGDELNLIEKGKNYGWPVITYGQNYNGTPITNITEKEGMEQPVKYWVPSIATCGMTLVTSDKYPAWKGNILVAALAGTHISRVEMNGTKATGEEKLLPGIGRVRQVSQSPDGFIYAITEGTGLLIKLLPAS
ncbi:PQQ-dependent sugar dehydrogenase [Algoriphagus sp.]|uniref:PQQ-dependent sugar dehydrogenase n=1 Tax=Algoriphagus sp. TaxID=1872435 RepID=UPI00271B60C8|nr:PQQ-dependent sugar dehydrogenase [Algoriphagus sp.]MDO8966115.1 PQQ-dependent sugar dehydrogenase [Algoriphagus sp.]MDP3200973.1 PQQ-dependent sugar dehydrogenase [Algoriphagus sp.]